MCRGGSLDLATRCSAGTSFHWFPLLDPDYALLSGDFSLHFAEWRMFSNDYLGNDAWIVIVIHGFLKIFLFYLIHHWFFFWSGYRILGNFFFSEAWELLLLISSVVDEKYRDILNPIFCHLIYPTLWKLFVIRKKWNMNMILKCLPTNCLFITGRNKKYKVEKLDNILNRWSIIAVEPPDLILWEGHNITFVVFQIKMLYLSLIIRKHERNKKWGASYYKNKKKIL